MLKTKRKETTGTNDVKHQIISIILNNLQINDSINGLKFLFFFIFFKPNSSYSV